MPGAPEGLNETALPDEEIDRFLPRSLHGAQKSPPASTSVS
jgi:hypothetical protein